jgi:anti-sigma factor RsiW
MSARNGSERDQLTPELLAAYVDGELTPAECRRVETWLAEHPDARADVEAQRRLGRLFEETAPPSPGDEQWAEALAGVESRLAGPPLRGADWRRRVTAWAAGLAAAAVLLALALRNPPAPPAVQREQPPAAEEAWPVVSPDEVDIVSMDDRDRAALVVGEPPVSEPMEMLSASEIEVNRMPDGPGGVARLHVVPGANGPVVFMSLGTEPEPAP